VPARTGDPTALAQGVRQFTAAAGVGEDRIVIKGVRIWISLPTSAVDRRTPAFTQHASTTYLCLKQVQPTRTSRRDGVGAGTATSHPYESDALAKDLRQAKVQLGYACRRLSSNSSEISSTISSNAPKNAALLWVAKLIVGSRFLP